MKRTVPVLLSCCAAGTQDSCLILQFLIPKWGNGSVTAFLKHMQVGNQLASNDVYNSALASGCMAHSAVKLTPFFALTLGFSENRRHLARLAAWS